MASATSPEATATALHATPQCVACTYPPRQLRISDAGGSTLHEGTLPATAAEACAVRLNAAGVCPLARRPRLSHRQPRTASYAGDLLAWADQQRGLHIHRLRGGELSPVGSCTMTAVASCLAWHQAASGAWQLLSGDADGQVCVWQLSASSTRQE